MLQSFLYYTPTHNNITSDAYVFRPQAHLSPANLSIDSFSFIDGPLVKELKLTFNESSLTQIVRLYSGLDNVMGNYLDVEIHIGPIELETDPLKGKEVSFYFLYYSFHIY